MLIPSIDLFNGQAVQWRQGKEHVLARGDVVDLLEQFSLFGEVAVIDLNAATGQGDNKELISQLLKIRPCRVGGGIRDEKTADYYLKAGAKKIILGTACQQPFVKKLPKNALIFALDARGDEWLKEGWQQGTGEKVSDIISTLSENCAEFLYTQVAKEGMLQGIDQQRVQAVVNASPIPVTIAGGITTLDDIKIINDLNANAQIGMAIYTGKMSLVDAFVQGVDFNKGNGLVPTIVQDYNTREVLMLAYSNEESLRQSFNDRRGIYYSRSKQSLWAKGDTSGHKQFLKQVDIDCDRDTLLFQVEQVGKACHLDRYSCFPSVAKPFNLTTLDQILEQRQTKPESGSYTSQLLKDHSLQIEKLKEECQELIEASQYEEVRWEVADLIFFALAYARANGVTLKAIESELRSRNRDH